MRVKVKMFKLSFQGEVELSQEKRRRNEIWALKEQMLDLDV